MSSSAGENEDAADATGQKRRAVRSKTSPKAKVAKVEEGKDVSPTPAGTEDTSNPMQVEEGEKHHVGTEETSTPMQKVESKSTRTATSATDNYLTDLMKLARCFSGKLGGAEKKAVQQTLVEISNQIGALQVSSSCSGSELQMLVGKSVARVFGGASQMCDYQTVFSCEKEGFKQRWIKGVHEAMCELPACCFKDMADIHGSSAPCAVHDGQCEVLGCKDGVLIHWAGFSCKTLSPLARSPASKTALPKKEGTTGSTFDHLVKYLKTHQVPIYIGENVKELLSSAVNVNYLKQTLASIGYCTMMRVLVSSNFKAPQHRQRTWIVALHLDLCKLTSGQGRGRLEAIFKTIDKMMDSDPMPLQQFILPNDSFYLQEHYMAKCKNQMNQKDQSPDVKWKKQYKAMLAEQRIRVSNAYPPECIRASPWYGILSERNRMVLGYEMHMDSSLTSVDVFQSMGRAMCGHNSQLGTVVPGSMVYVTTPEVNRLLCGLDYMQIQGLPRTFPTAKIMKKVDVSDGMLQDMAGNAFSSQVAMAVLIGVLVNFPEGLLTQMTALMEARELPVPTTSEDVLDSMAL